MKATHVILKRQSLNSSKK